MFGDETVPSPSRRWDRLLDSVRTHDWIVPAVMVAAATALAFTMDALDQVVQGRLEPVWWLFSGEQKTARQLLSAIAAAMVAVVTMAFSVTVTALTLVAQHYGTQVIRTFMRNLTTQVVIGAFPATFVYALMILRSVHNASNDESLPRIAITVGILLALASFGLLLYFLYHVSESLDAPNVVASVAHDLERVIERTTRRTDGRPVSEPAEAPGTAAERARVIEAATSGYLQTIDCAELVATAQRHDAIIRLQCRIGRFVLRGDRLATVDGAGAARLPAGCVHNALSLGAKRTLEQDVEFGIDQLVQVAIRGLSPGRNDTFTTMLCLDRLGAALSLLADRRFPPSVLRDGDGRPRLVMHPPTFAELVDRAFEQIHSFGGETTVVAIRLLRTLKAIALRAQRPGDRAALRRHAVQVHEASRQQLGERLGIEAIEAEFRETMAALEEDHRRSAAA
ncbi:DUF2254 domain-containing protein [Nitrospira moscoviensis]|uniref:DUF2254 domain-containing protein n=1 Tax=Nitrospira moscoviensis TaxID=42253 RepID=A0A0K2GE63_NITMO|nr:DUF2254 domain-containing protein [Nitrospira moscoviensis]ALA59250.1 conserved membrane protein of unknown function [Nitrospira moscoviensis]